MDVIFLEQYHFACYAIAVSCVIELCAEVPVFLTQVFCFVKLKVLLNTLHIFVRSVVFLWIVTGNGSIAIYAFAIAQLASAATIIVGHYGFFAYYIKTLNNYKLENKDKSTQKQPASLDNSLFANMDDFPFTKLSQFLPGALPNEVC